MNSTAVSKTIPAWTTGGEKVDLTNCDREPIHLIGGVQFHGALFTIRRKDFTIIQASANIEKLLGVSVQSVLNSKFTHLLSPEDEIRFNSQLKEVTQTQEPRPMKLSFALPGNRTQPCNALLYPSGEVLVVEFETLTEVEPLLSFFDFYQNFSDSISRLHGATTVKELCDLAVKEVKAISGFDRVWIHHVVDEGHLRVIAEEKRSDMDPFLGKYFPATDIPKQARRLFTMNRFRLITDVIAPPEALIPEMNPDTNAPLDLSHSLLRAVSPVHVVYLSNIRVRASMSVSLVQDGELWGLISCHHESPHILPYQQRAACEFIGRIVSLQIPVLEAREDARSELELRKHMSPLIELFSKGQESKILAALPQYETNVLNLVRADGAMICIRNEKPILLGKTPALDEAEDLAKWLSQQSHLELFTTDKLASIYPKAKSYIESVSGLMSISLSGREKYLVTWFRGEQKQTIPWGGNPKRSFESTEIGLSLTPRKSFELWNELVHGKSLPWQPAERRVALDLRLTLTNLIVERGEMLLSLNHELEQSNQELDSFSYVASHDLKEPVRGLHTYATFLIEDYGDKLDAEGRKKLGKMIEMTERMNALIDSLLTFSRVGRLELSAKPTDLNDVLLEVQDSIRPRIDEAGIRVNIVNPLPVIACDRIRVAEVFHNLILNGIKYNESAEKQIDIGWLKQPSPVDASTSEAVFFVRDNGIGIADKHKDLVFQIFKRLHAQDKYGGGSGAGLTIVKKIIDRHGGRIWLESKVGVGTTFFFTLRSS